MVPRTGPVVLRPFADTAALAAQARCTYRTTAAPQQQGRPGMNTTRRAVAAAAATILSVTVVTALPARPATVKCGVRAAAQAAPTGS